MKPHSLFRYFVQLMCKLADCSAAQWLILYNMLFN